MKRLTLAILLGVFLGEIIFLLVLSPGEDFWQHYSAAQAIRSGIAIHETPRSTFGGWIYPYPMFTAVLVLPLSFLTPPAAFALWVFILYSGLSISTFFFARMVTKADTQRALLMTTLALAWPVTFMAVFMGQITPLVLTSLMSACVVAQVKRPYLSGLILSLALVKPHLVTPIIVGLAIKKKWPLLSGFAVGALMVGAISLAAGQTTSMMAWREYLFGWLLGSGRSVSPITQLPLLSLSSRMILGVLGYCVLGIWWWRKQTLSPTDAALGFLLTLCLSLYLPAYDLVLLIPIFVLLMNETDAFFWAAIALSSVASFRYRFAPLLSLSMICLAVALLRFQGSAKTFPARH